MKIKVINTRNQNFLDIPLHIWGVVKGLHCDIFCVSCKVLSLILFLTPSSKELCSNLPYFFPLFLFLCSHLFYSWVWGSGGNVGSQPQKLPEWNLRLVSQYTEVKENPKKADHSKWVGGSFMYEACLRCHKVSRSPHPSARILKLYIEALSGSVTYNKSVVQIMGLWWKKIVSHFGNHYLDLCFLLRVPPLCCLPS